MAIEILEQNHNESKIILAGINNNGLNFAKMIHKELKKICDQNIEVTNIRLNPAMPLEDEISIKMSTEELNNSVIIIIDDVANTGRTLFYAMKPLMDILPKKVQVAVLVNRKHKSFPVNIDYVGLSLATTLMENIQVDLKAKKEIGAFLN
jgi:pyrimidine operon attenuation protein/uracil phosphoribosyltransferase